MAESPLIEALNAPVPLPLEVWLLDIVGYCDVLQQMPLVVTGNPPSEVTLPPLTALLAVILLTVLVVTEGNPLFVEKLIWLE